jgi:hypothetical protein
LEKFKIPRDVVDIYCELVVIDEWLMSTNVMGEFDVFYMNPQRCGYGTQCLSMKNVIKDGLNPGNSLMDG